MKQETFIKRMTKYERRLKSDKDHGVDTPCFGGYQIDTINGQLVGLIEIDRAQLYHINMLYKDLGGAQAVDKMYLDGFEYKIKIFVYMK